jgi:hypothetical protein
MTSFNTDSGCRWVAHKETCTLRQAIVNYAVVLKSDTISLRYPYWQNDTVNRHFSGSLLTLTKEWKTALKELYKPVRLYGADDGIDHFNDTITFRDTARFAASSPCGTTWSNPMQVVKSLLFIFLSSHLSASFSLMHSLLRFLYTKKLFFQLDNTRRHARLRLSCLFYRR